MSDGEVRALDKGRTERRLSGDLVWGFGLVTSSDSLDVTVQCGAVFDEDGAAYCAVEEDVVVDVPPGEEVAIWLDPGPDVSPRERVQTASSPLGLPGRAILLWRVQAGEDGVRRTVDYRRLQPRVEPSWSASEKRYIVPCADHPSGRGEVPDLVGRRDAFPPLGHLSGFELVILVTSLVGVVAVLIVLGVWLV